MKKRYLTKLIALLTVFVLAFGMSGCLLMGGGNSDPKDEPSTASTTGDTGDTGDAKAPEAPSTPVTASAMSGTYKLSKFTMTDGESVSGNDLEELLPADETYIEFGSGDKVTFVLMGEEIETTYEVDGDILIVEDGSEDLYFDIDGDTISYTTEDGTLYFSK